MIKQYFKQALAQLRQHPLISVISIAGTALAFPYYVGSDATTSEGRSFFSRVKPESFSACALYEHKS